MFDNRMIAILMDLFKNKPLTLYELSVKTGIEKERLLDNLKAINDLLEQNQFVPLSQDDQGFYQVGQELFAQKEAVFALFQAQNVYLNQNERLNIIYLYTFCRQDFISNYHYQSLLNVSRNTTLSDIKWLKEKCLDFQVRLDYSRARGYHLLGDEKDKHRLALYMISNLLQSPIGEWSMAYIFEAWQEKSVFDRLKILSDKVIKLYGLSPIEGRLEESLYFLDFLGLRYQRVQEKLQPDSKVKSPAISHLGKQLADELRARGDRAAFPQQLDSYCRSLLQGCFEGELDSKDIFFHKLTIDIVEEMERLSLIEFDNREDLIAGLERHLIPAYYRLKSQLLSVNSYTEVVKEEHANLFRLVKEALSPLEKHLGFAIPDSEVSYFVIHFGGYLQRQEEAQYHYRALVICPNGVSSSLILKENLKALFPRIDFLEAQSLEHFKSRQARDCDMIFATVKLETDLPFFLVPALFSSQQKKELFQMVKEIFPQATGYPLEVNQLLKVIRQHATIHDEEALTFDLMQYLVNYLKKKERRSPLLEELITEESYQNTSQELTWQEAIRVAAQPLLANDSIEDSYIDAMIQNVEDFGPFIDLGKGVAIPHARPDDGVKQIGMSMMSLEKPIYLLDDASHEIKLLICIAAVDNQTHLKALSHLTAILRDSDNIEKLVNSKSFSDIADLLKED